MDVAISARAHALDTRKTVIGFRVLVIKLPFPLGERKQSNKMRVSILDFNHVSTIVFCHEKKFMKKAEAKFGSFKILNN